MPQDNAVQALKKASSLRAGSPNDAPMPQEGGEALGRMSGIGHLLGEIAGSPMGQVAAGALPFPALGNLWSRLKGGSGAVQALQKGAPGPLDEMLRASKPASRPTGPPPDLWGPDHAADMSQMAERLATGAPGAGVVGDEAAYVGRALEPYLKMLRGQ